MVHAMSSAKSYYWAAILASNMARLFTREEAENALPQIVTLLWKLKSLKPNHDEAEGRLTGLQQKSQTNGHAIDVDTARASTDRQRIAVEIQGIIDRISEMGAEVKDIEIGLIDFRSLIDGREVYLCWKLGEERIEWWHDLDSGYESRRRLD